MTKNECETVAHCSKHGCIPKQPEYKDAIEVSVIFHEGQKMFAVPKQPAQQEPVAWLKVVETLGGWGKFVEAKPNEKGAKPVYTSPPAQRTWQGLTFAEICECENDYLHIFARAIEAKLKEKNGGVV
jgi:hypothetical protein